MSATFWAQPNPGVRYVRCVLPARALGGQVLSLDEERARFGDGNALVRQERVAVWQLPSTPRILEFIVEGRKRAPVLVEVDDDYTVWNEWYGARGNWQEGWPEDPRVSSVQVHRSLAEGCDGVIVSTPHLADVYSKLNRNVFVCRNGIDPANWPDPPERTDEFTVVFAGAPNVNDLVLVRRAMEYAARQDGVRALVLGYHVDWRGVECIPWQNDLALFRGILAGLKPDVGLRPVDQTSFSKGKSDLKVLEYAMVQAMPIVTAFAPYRDWIGSDLVKWAHDAKGWESAVRWAVRHRDEVRDMAAKLREKVIRERGLETIRAEWTEPIAFAEQRGIAA